ncbi:WYL domain-containing protein, partial [Streptomyces sp. TRM76130]|nr:WYL domain-containing protein [Streptomyces sp. TRM76130]
ADAVGGRRPVAVEYTSGAGRTGERTLHPHGLVVHAGKLYVTATDAATGEERTFRLDRMSGARVLPGSFTPPAGEPPDPARRLLTAFATAPYRHAVSLRIRGTAERIRTRLPPGVAVVTELPLTDGTDPADGRWSRAELRVERLDWLPGVLAALDLPFVVERPDALRGLVEDLARRLADSARRDP